MTVFPLNTPILLHEQIKMFNRVSYTVPVTHTEMETIRIQTSNTSSDYQIPLIAISTAEGDEKFSVHTKSFFNENVIIRSIAKFSGTFTLGKSIDLGKSSRPKIIGLKQKTRKSLKISTNTQLSNDTVGTIDFPYQYP